jgi:hypothetical protein
MMWVRSKIRQASLLALFALAMQLGLSFGHIHADAAFNGALSAKQAPIGGASIVAQSPIHSQHDDGLAADSCAICATIALANTLVTAAAPVLPAPPIFALHISEATPEVASLNVARPAFHSRAPPNA